MTKNQVTELPQRIISASKRSAKLSEFNALYRNMVDAYRKLPLHCGEDAIPLNPKLITANRFGNYVAKIKSGLSESQAQVWNQMLSDFLTNIKPINAFFAAFPTAECNVDVEPSTPVEKRFTCTNKNEAIDAESWVDVPESAFSYFERIKAANAAIQRLNDYERANGIRRRTNEETISYSQHADDFAQKWIDGYFNKR